MIELKDCRCPICGYWICANNGVTKSVCNGRHLKSHPKVEIVFRDGKVISKSFA